MKKYKECAEIFCNAIKELATPGNEDAMNNFESYLSNHFAEWLEKYASDPIGICQELCCFSTMFKGA